MQAPICLLLIIQFSFIFRHTYIFAMHNIEVHSKILDREKIIAIHLAVVFTHENSNLFALLSTTRIVNLHKCNIPYVDK